MTYFIYQPRTNFSQFGTAALKPTKIIEINERATEVPTEGIEKHRACCCGH